MKKITILTVMLFVQLTSLNAQMCKGLTALFEAVAWETEGYSDLGKDRLFFTETTFQAERYKQEDMDKKNYALIVYINRFIADTNYFNQAELYYIKANIDTSKMDFAFSDSAKILLNKSYIKQPITKSDFAHNFVVNIHLGDIMLKNENIDSSLYYYKKAEQDLENSYDYVEKYFHLDLITYYYKYANLLLTIEKHDKIKAKNLFDKCILLSKKYNIENYAEFCNIIINHYKL